ncbi:gas vesicle protein [Isoptericola cucumis]|uniref:Gas vesicle protein n=1 Tax=Isoptericola cucumis TaxID=1776856 RepID=A0ABQ2B727_9MICO|nr:gas vesicle protein [Isoptericola cucumis]GGI06756.1 hypothetical protein GCM10007368_12750 [Isoptericola cucumis]
MSTSGIAARTGAETTPSMVDDDAPSRPIALVDLLDRLLGTGVVLSGDITISLSGIDLVEIHLHALITSVRVEAARTP